MAESTLHQVERLVEQLSPHERAHVLAFLALRMAQRVTSTLGLPSSCVPRTSPLPLPPPRAPRDARSAHSKPRIGLTMEALDQGPGNRSPVFLIEGERLLQQAFGGRAHTA